jgi:hypothetical protein
MPFERTVTGKWLVQCPVCPCQAAPLFGRQQGMLCGVVVSLQADSTVCMPGRQRTWSMIVFCMGHHCTIVCRLGPLA